jgi:hypothetical protein
MFRMTAEKDVVAIAKHFKFCVLPSTKLPLSFGASAKAVYSGIDFYEYREYKEGDDIRFIDWNLLARLDKKIIRTFCSEFTARVDILLDTSGSMLLGNPPKKELAERITLFLASVAKISNFPCRIYTFADSKCVICRSLNDFLHKSFNGKLEYKGTTYLNTMLSDYKRNRGNSVADILFLISDLHSQDSIELFFKTVSRMAKEVVLINVFSFSEIEQIKVGKVAIVEPETGQKREIYVSSLTRRTILENYSKYLMLLKSLAGRNRIYLIQIDSGASIFTVVSNLMKFKLIKKEK